MKSKHEDHLENQQTENTVDAARPPQINLDRNQDRVFFEDLDIPDDLELFEDIASEEEINKLAEDIEKSLAETCGECTVKDRYRDKIKLKLKSLEKSKRLLQKLVKEKTLLLEDAREKLSKKTEENIVLCTKLETKLISEALESWEPEVQVVELKCPICDEKYSTNQVLKTHIDLKHTKYKCKQCNLTFPNKVGHDVHMKKKHSPNFRCEMCDTNLGSKYHLERHVSQVLTTENQVQCIVCPFSDSNEDVVIKHLDQDHFKFPERSSNIHKTISHPCKNGVYCTYLRENRCIFSHDNHVKAQEQVTHRMPKRPQEQEWQEFRNRKTMSFNKPIPSGHQGNESTKGVLACKFGDKCNKGRFCAFRHREFGKYRLVFSSNQSKNRRV